MRIIALNAEECKPCRGTGKVTKISLIKGEKKKELVTCTHCDGYGYVVKSEGL
jgi:DnaJ-class molecular chaperone